MSDNTNLEDMLDNLIDSKDDQAQIFFHDFAKQKMKDIISGETTDDVDDTTNKE